MGNAGFEKDTSLPVHFTVSNDNENKEMQNTEPKSRKFPHYHRMAKQCGFPKTVDQSLEFHADRLDRMCFCASRYGSRLQADDMTRHFCHDWHLSNTTGPVDLSWSFFYHARPLIKNDADRIPETQIEQLNRGWNYLQRLQLGDVNDKAKD
jgi:hypothetical protein